MLINDDCLNALDQFENEYADMIYLDPPFFTQKNQSLYNKFGDYFEFNDKWNSLDEYLEYIEKRLIKIKRVLKKQEVFFYTVILLHPIIYEFFLKIFLVKTILEVKLFGHIRDGRILKRDY